MNSEICTQLSALILIASKIIMAMLAIRRGFRTLTMKRSIVGQINYSDTSFMRTVIAMDFGLAPGYSPTLTLSANRR